MRAVVFDGVPDGRSVDFGEGLEVHEPMRADALVFFFFLKKKQWIERKGYV